MQNNIKEQEQNTKNAILLFSHWLEDLDSFATPAEHRAFNQDLFGTFYSSDVASDKKLRSSAVWYQTKLENLFYILDLMTPEQRLLIQDLNQEQLDKAEFIIDKLFYSKITDDDDVQK